jgi:hypothetical protein
MRKLALALLLALGLCGPAAAQRSGIYVVTGTNLDGSPYEGSMQIIQIGAASFRVTWSIGGDIIEGVGMVSGLTFVTAFSVGDQTGLGIYDIRPGDVLEGTWTLVGAFNTGQETARPR